MEIRRRFSLFFILLCHLSLTTTGWSFEKQEWILTRSPSTLTWNKILSRVPELEFIKSFGFRDKYVLVRAKSKIRKTLPKEVIALQRNHIYRSSENKDPDLVKSWGLFNTGQVVADFGAGLSGIDVGAMKMWESERTSSKTIIATLDTGMDLKHEDLKNNLWVNKLESEGNQLDDDMNGWINDVNGWNFVSDNNVVQDDNNHGTAVAGIIAADANNAKGSRGLLAASQLMIVKILDANGTGTTERAVQGIEYAIRNGAKVINASWGGSSYDQVLFDTLRRANEEGVLFVCAAGNDFKDNDMDPHPVYPASFKLPNVISVAAHDPSGGLASFSNFGKETVHLAAPGVGIFSTIIGGYSFVNGTSFAAPFVTAVGALLKARESELEPSDIRKRIVSTVVPMHYYLKEKLVSGGRLQGYQALKNIVTVKPEPPKDWKRVNKAFESEHPYPNNLKQSFEITQPGATHLRVHFSQLDLEAQYDFISLRDKEGLEAISYTGKQNDFWSADVLGDFLKIEFKTDYSNPQWGFAIDAVEYSSN